MHKKFVFHKTTLYKHVKILFIDGYRSTSRRSNVTTPFGYPQGYPLGRVVSPVNTVKPGYTLASGKSSTLPTR